MSTFLAGFGTVGVIVFGFLGTVVGSAALFLTPFVATPLLPFVAVSLVGSAVLSSIYVIYRVLLDLATGLPMLQSPQKLLEPTWLGKLMLGRL